LPLLILSKMTPDELQRFVGIAAKALAWDDDRMKEECEPNQAGNAFARFYQLYL